MKLTRYVRGFALAVPVLSGAQATGNGASPEMKAAYESMQLNVARIAFKPETERWQANRDLWSFQLKNAVKIDAADFRLMEVPFATMQANVGKLIEPREKERWVLNHDMWQLAMGISGVPAEGVAPTLRSMYGKMRANVDRITEPEEKERWTVNTVLWKALIDRK